MDKATIKKYKSEFNAWLDDKDVLYRYVRDDFHTESGWMVLTGGVNLFSPNCIYITPEYKEIKQAYYDGMVDQLEYNACLPFVDNKWHNWADYIDDYDLIHGADGYINDFPITRPQQFRLKETK